MFREDNKYKPFSITIDPFEEMGFGKGSGGKKSHTKNT